MCTASWLKTEAGFELFFNRDESIHRLPAEAPRIRDFDGIAAIAPTDRDAGGTWIGANQYGLALMLLNAWQAQVPVPSDGFRSRGLLVADLLPAASSSLVRERLSSVDLARYRGFQLVVIEPAGDPRLWSWDGRELGETKASMPMTSSSLDGARANAERRELLGRMTSTAAVSRDTLERFHSSHEPERGAWSPCMHRVDAETVSASRIRVACNQIEFTYAAGPLCSTPWGESVHMPRLPRPRLRAGTKA